MAVIAVTGDIGAGKSSLSRIIARLIDYPVMDADRIAAEVWTRKDVKGVFAERWGSDILDAHGNIIKPRIADKIFTDTEEYKFCNAVIHPIVMNEIQRLTEIIDAVAEIPLLPETGRPKWIDHAVYVTADFPVRAERCRKSRGWSDDELKRREKFLLPQSERLKVCDYVIRSEGSLSELKAQVVKFLQENKLDVEKM